MTLVPDDHDGYDCAEYPKMQSFGQTESATLKIVQNPYYGGEVEVNESEFNTAVKAERTSLREDIKVTQNPYYQ